MLKTILNKLQKTKTKKFSEPALMNTVSRLPVCFVRGEGSTLWDDDGKPYLDALGGIAVTILGHSHPQINQTISLQASQLLHVSNWFHIKEQAQLGEKFCQISGMDKAFFCNSGAEANEAAIKIARLYGSNKGIKKPTIITAKGSFHGRTMATLSATGNETLQKGFHPLLADFIYVDFNNIDAIRKQAYNANVVAVMMEPIQGEGGIVIPDQGYLKQLRELCDEFGWLLILDEIQTGMGRTGKWFAYQHEEVLPDIVTCAKALGNGIPIGACAARGKAAEVFRPGSHGTTFGGNPFACKVALTVIDIIEQDGLMDNARVMGASIKKQLQQTIGTHEKVVDIRGKGLLLAVELDKTYPNLAQTFLDNGLVINMTKGGRAIRILPAAIISQAQANQIASIVHDVITDL